MDDDAQPGAALFVAQRPHLLRADPLSLDSDTLAQRLKGGRRRMAIEQRLILFLDAEARMGDPKGDVSVIGQQQQSRRVTVEPPDRDNPLGNVDQVEHRPPAALVSGGRDVAFRLVE